MKKILLIALIQFIVSCNTSQPKIERPLDVWVFRSVLDERPRVATVALNKKMWLAYDTQTGNLFKVWNGQVNFDGSVYDGKHGTQPSSSGQEYFNEQEEWTLRKDGNEYLPKVQYKGHKFIDGEVIFKTILYTPDNKKIIIEESPIYVNKGNKNGLLRKFKSINDSSFDVVLKTVITSLEDSDDYSTDGNFEQSKKEIFDLFDESGTATDYRGTLVLNKKTTNLHMYFHDDFAKINRKEGIPERDLTLEIKKPIGAQLIEENDCVSCHNETEKTVGPAYIDIAKKYSDDDNTINRLSNRVKNGSKGIWSETQMTPHPELSDEEIAQMVKYVLSLDDKRKSNLGGYPEKYSLNEKSVYLDFQEKQKPNKGSGLVASLYVVNPYSQERQYSEKPIKSAVIPYIHTLNKDDFGEIKDSLKILFQGNLVIPETKSYNFRLINDDDGELYIDGKEIIKNRDNKGFFAVDGEIYLNKGKHQIKIVYEQDERAAAVSLQWFDDSLNKFQLVPEDLLSHNMEHFEEIESISKNDQEMVLVPGDQFPLNSMHPAFDLFQLRPEQFQPRVGGIDFLSDSTMVLSTWDAEGSVFLLKNYLAENPEDIVVKRIATGFAEPLGLKVVNDDIYVLQKQELTKLLDHNGDEITDEYETISNDWKVSANFHEFAFGLEYTEGYFYASLATAIMPGGASSDPQIPDRGKVMKISLANGSVEFIASGLRTPNGIGLIGKEIFVADNQGDWLPASKILHIEKGMFYGSHSVDPIGTKDLEEKLPVVYIPQDEIGSSPSTPTNINLGPYQNQLIFGDVSHGGIKRVAYENIEGQLQGALFRFAQGLEAGVNRICWAPDGSLIVGGIGLSGNWMQTGKLKFGLQRMKYNGNSVFEMLRVNALPDGFEIEFTEAISENVIIQKDDIGIKQWYYIPTSKYGGPKIDLEELKIEKLIMSKDRKKIRLVLKGIKEKHLVYFHLNNKITSTNNSKLWTTEAWYTLNKIPNTIYK
tara:strand:+ start:11278 stop:14241 length:2964 start_codon:yes stop_codon:yes gene_type:complete